MLTPHLINFLAHFPIFIFTLGILGLFVWAYHGIKMTLKKSEGLLQKNDSFWERLDNPDDYH